VMVRARMGNSGDRFNLGEASVTRCVVRHHASDARVTAGVGYVLGLDAERATAVAQLDALLQHEALHALLWPSVIEALRAQVEQRQRDELARTASSRVQFYTLQPEAT
jgi:alpha-D-ribose 1-methylphosphonate 5-triphosphate synthase subunit PhnG